MASEIEELKEMIRRVGALAEDTNNTVHKMHRASRWSLVLTAVWWLSIVGFTGIVYYYFLAPYIETIFQLYGGAQDILQNFRP